jgi:amidase
MRFDEYRTHDGLGLAELVRRGEVAPSELVDAAIEGIERLNPRLNAVVYQAYDEARATAKGPLTGPFAGVPFLIKDLNVAVAGWPCSAASLFATDEPAAADSELIARYRSSGLVFLGLTNTPEYGIPGVTTSERFGPCRNPWNPDHISGGSSGGAAAATAAGIVPLAHASDGLGSIRIPAACCGLVGLKVTRDRNPNGPYDPDRAIGFSVDHVVTRTVRDSAAMLDVTGRPEADSPYAPPPKAGPYLDEVATPPGRLRIAVLEADRWPLPIDPEVQAAVDGVVALLAELGHEIVPHTIDVDWRRLYRAQGRVSSANFAASMRRRVEEVGHEPAEGELGPLAQRAYDSGRRIGGQAALLGWQELRLLTRRIVGDLAPFDVYVSPVLSTPVPRVDELDPIAMDLADFDQRQGRTMPFTPPFNFTGQPSMSLPLAWSASGLPIGVMFTARYADEATLFRLAAQLEEARPWRDRTPDLAALAAPE